MIFLSAIRLTVLLALALAQRATAEVTVNPGDLIVSDELAGLFVVDPSTCSFTVIPTGGLPATPGNVALTDQGELLVVDGPAQALYKVAPNSGETAIVSTGGELHNPLDVAVRSGPEVFVIDGGDLFSGVLPAVVQVDFQTGSQSLCFYDPASGLEAPFSLALEPGGTVLVTDLGGGILLPSSLHRVTCGLDGFGSTTELASRGSIVLPVGVDIDSAGLAYVIDLQGRLVRVDDSQPPGSRQTLLHSGAPLQTPVGIAVDDQDRILIVDSGANAIFRWASGSGVSTVCSGAPMSLPTDLVVVPEPSLILSFAAGLGALAGLAQIRARGRRLA